MPSRMPTLDHPDAAAPSPVYGRGSVRDRWLTWRDRLLASNRFQQWVLANPLTRPIARRHTRRLFDLCAGFVYTQVLLACVRLDLFGRLVQGPVPLEVLARQLSVPVDALERLLEAAVSLGLLERRGGTGSARRYGLGQLGAAMAGNPGIATMVEHHALLYTDLQDPLALLRADRGDTRLARFWDYGGSPDGTAEGEARFAAYSRVMAASQPMVAAEVVAAYPFRRHRRVLDVGGGEGVFLRAIAAAAPSLSLVLFDLPPVAAVARTRLTEDGLTDRAEVIGGSFLSDPLPRGADLVTLIRVLHDHGDETVLKLLNKVRSALAPGGTVLVAEMMRAGDGAGGGDPVSDAYFDFYLMAMGEGRLRTPGRIMDLMGQAGFRAQREIRTRNPLMARLVAARVSET